MLRCGQRAFQTQKAGRVAGKPSSGYSMAKHKAKYTLTFAHEAPNVEVLVLHAQHLALTHIPTGAAQDSRAGWLLQGVMSSLGL